MDNIGDILINLAPNLILAAWVIYRQDKVIEQLLDTQKWMVEQLMKLHPPQDENKPQDVEKA